VIPKPSGGAKVVIAAAVLCVGFLLLLMLIGTLAVANGTAQGESETCKVTGGSESPPPKLVPIYVAAAKAYHLGPRGPGILASINFYETSFGTNMGTSEAGAIGWMQFLPESWEAFGVDANGDGRKDPYDPEDAIFAAARLLRYSGAPKDWYGAIWSYNHADWYVEEVEALAAKYNGPVECTPTGPTTLGPLPAEALKRIEYVARWIESKRLHYCWGGGHLPKPGPSPGTGEFCGPGVKGLDCSGSVRWLLVLSGYPDPGGIVSGDFATAYPSGPGKVVTIWSNVTHVFIEINGRDWTTSEFNFAHGPAFQDHTTVGFVASHPPGL
jgi:hypothetical protein